MTLRMVGAACALLGWAGAAEAKTFVIYTDAMSLGRHVVVLDTRGPDRVLMCMAPPAESGCTVLRPRRQR